jgi:hypothetical protein
MSNMQFNKTAVTVTAATFDENCNIKECINCSEEFIKNAVEKCIEMKRK